MTYRTPLIRDATTNLPSEIHTGDTINPAYTSPIRSTATITSATGAQVTGTIALASMGRLLNLSSNSPLRLRLYTTVAHQAADLSRPVSTYPSPGSGLLFEGVTTPSMTSLDIGPMVDFFNNELTVTNAIAYCLQPTVATSTTATLVYMIIQV